MILKMNLNRFDLTFFGSLMRRSEWYTVVYETCSIVNDCYETIPTYIFVFCWTVYHCTKTKGCSNEFLLNETCRVTGRTSLLIHYHEQKSSNGIRPIHRKPIHLNLTKFQSINDTESDLISCLFAVSRFSIHSNRKTSKTELTKK